ncbi:uncharacterized protein [Arachis hypogaea]|uniref:uncharacterized protein isoform X4 n=1 Tax=Arachis hypogaea TaxID=3818 RepID=UPI003B225AE4
MLYSSNEELRNSSSDFWCAVLSSRKEKAFPELGSCNLLQSFLNNELNSLVELAAEKVLHSSNEELRNSSSDFWCAILSCGKELDQLPVKIGWFPEYSDLRRALDT